MMPPNLPSLQDLQAMIMEEFPNLVSGAGIFALDD